MNIPMVSQVTNLDSCTPSLVGIPGFSLILTPGKFILRETPRSRPCGSALLFSYN
jgi:hypothetical protein